jgi:ubiquitin carboxyl-terminal hydrolase 4/11/15
VIGDPIEKILSNGLYQRKLDLKADDPDQLDMTPFVKQRGNGYNFKLVAVIEHSGGLGGGNYVADVFCRPLTKWYRFSDDTVKPIKQSDVHSEHGYVLFYEQCTD